MINRHYKINKLWAVILTLTIFFSYTFTGCKKFIEVPSPVTNITEASAYASDATAIAVLTGIYAKISGTTGTFSPSFSNISGLTAGLSADEFSLWSGVSSPFLIAYYTNSLSASGNTGVETWNECYKYIFTCNAAIEGIAQSLSLTTEVKQQLLGEAKFMRAFLYFYLVNLYGDVPLSLTVDYRRNAKLSRSDSSLVYQQIITDLLEAKDLLSATFLDQSLLKTTNERVRPTKWAASALLARVYLYTHQWANAELESTLLISNTALFKLNTLPNVFNKNNIEAIWQLQPINVGWNTEHARLFLLPSSGPSVTNPVYLNKNLVSSFQNIDNRKTNWISYIKVGVDTFYFPYKYKALNISTNPPASPSEYLMVLRLGEQYLIRAEARAEQNNISGGEADLNEIRKRAGLPVISPTTDISIMRNNILNERRLELFSEWGNRWLDLNRTGKIDAVMSQATPLKGGIWNTNQKLYPIPASEIQYNSNLIQNAGY
jgi:starch-binding outer membrane protein, SusD/RagB family